MSTDPYRRFDALVQGAERVTVSGRATALGGAQIGFELKSQRGRTSGKTAPLVGGRLPDFGTYRARNMEDVVDKTVRRLVGAKVRWETVTISIATCPTPTKDLLPVALLCLAKGLKQKAPDLDAIADERAAWKKQLAADKTLHLAQTRARKAAAADAETKRQLDAQRLTRRKPDRPGVDVASFIDALQTRIGDAPRIKKATSMLKKAGFQLYSNVGPTQLEGVVKSQTDASLVYACQLTEEGRFSCCTQNLNACGGLRGKPCKHLLVLLIGLTQAGELDPVPIDAWVEATRDHAPKLDRDVLGDVFLRYKGAEAGEIDWRPTETVPEDFYAY